MSDIEQGPVDEAIADITEAAEVQDEAVDLSDLLNLLRETILDHEIRLMSIEDFLTKLVEQIKSEIEGEAADATTDGSMNGKVDIQVVTKNDSGDAGS